MMIGFSSISTWVIGDKGTECRVIWYHHSKGWQISHLLEDCIRFGQENCLTNLLGETRVEDERWRFQELNRRTELQTFRETDYSHAEISRPTVRAFTANRLF